MTGIILEIKCDRIENAVAFEFYIEREKSVRFKKDELIKVMCEGDVKRYFAMIDANMLGRGHLMCRAEFVDDEVVWRRPVVASGYTGYSIPCMGNGNSIACEDYEVTFERVSDIPCSGIYYGALKSQVEKYEDITGEIIKELSVLPAGLFEFEASLTEGDRFVIAIPSYCNSQACKDDGFGKLVEFNNSVMHANGDVEVDVDGIEYKIYGEFILVDGKRIIYIT